MKQTKFKNDRLFYVPLSEVAKILNVKIHVLYYWEKKFPELKPYRISQRKFYKQEQVELLKKIKSLTDEGYTLEAIKKFLFAPKKRIKISHAESSTQPQQKEDDIKKVVKEVLQELKQIYESL